MSEENVRDRREMLLKAIADGDSDSINPRDYTEKLMSEAAEGEETRSSAREHVDLFINAITGGSGGGNPNTITTTETTLDQAALAAAARVADMLSNDVTIKFDFVDFDTTNPVSMYFYPNDLGDVVQGVACNTTRGTWGLLMNSVYIITVGILGGTAAISHFWWQGADDPYLPVDVPGTLTVIEHPMPEV